MFEKLKKSKTLRSLLGAASLFMAGAPTVVEAAPKAPQKVTQTVQSNCAILAQSYMPLCEQLEGNIPYCYKDEGVKTTGCGVHFLDFSELKKLTAIKLTPKKGCSFKLKQTKRLQKMADANWKAIVTKAMFPEVEKAEVINLKDCVDLCPKGEDEVWKNALVVLPSASLKKVNKCAADFFVQKAYESHPNLFQLSPSARLVVVDLLYNLGDSKYGKTFPKFQEAVRANNLAKMKKECCTKNNRRDPIRQCLLDAALLVAQKNPKMTKAELLKWIRTPVVQKNAKLAPKLEKVLWSTLDGLASKEFDYGKALLNFGSMYAKTGTRSVRK